MIFDVCFLSEYFKFVTKLENMFVQHISYEHLVLYRPFLVNVLNIYF